MKIGEWFRSPKSLLILTGSLYLVTLRFPFIALDDSKHIWQNPYVMAFSSANLAHFWEGPYYGLYIPMVYSTWSVLAAITKALHWQNDVTVIQGYLFHLANFVLHLANVWMLWQLFAFWISRYQSALPEDRPRIGGLASLAALVFALHPLQVEAVAWASGLKDTLSTWFCLIALLGFSAHFFPPKDSKRKKFDEPYWPLPKWATKHAAKVWFIGCALAFLTKPNTVVLPVLAVVLVAAVNMPAWKSAVRWSLLPLTGALLMIFITKHVQPDARLDFHLELWQRPLVALASLGFYFVKTLWPFPLAPDYGLSPDRLLSANLVGIYYAAGAILLGMGLWAFLKKRWILFLGSAFIAIGFGPVLGFIPFEFQNLSTVADRYFYLFPAIGWGWLLYSTTQLPQFSLSKALPLLVVLWWPASLVQTLKWQDNDHLFRHTAEVNPQSYLAWNNIALQELRRGEFDSAIEHFQKALAANPNYLAAISNLGVVYFKKNDFPKTIEHYERYLGMLPPAGPGSPATYGDMYFNLGAAQVNLQRIDEAQKNLRQAVLINPDHFLAHFHLGRVLAARGDREGARAELLQASRLQPGDKNVQAELQKLGH